MAGTLGRTVVVQVGQCGNQLGSDFFSALADGALSDCAEELPAFFRPGRSDVSPAVPRAAMLDAEPRVISEVVRRTRVVPPCWRYDPVQPGLKAVWESGAASGSANNWAMGYNVQSSVLAECVRESVRREAEHAEQLQDFLFMQSLAGGTGSGVGTKISEILRDEYPSASQLHCVVWPYSSGEIAIQNYNLVLSLSHLHACSDGLIGLRNDHAHEVCRQLLRKSRPELSDLNGVLADGLAKVFLPSLPSDAAEYDTAYSIRPLDISRELCRSPSHKLLSIKTIPQMPAASHKFTNDLWSTLSKHMLQMLVTDSHLSECMDWAVKPTDARINRSIGNMVFYRGTDYREGQDGAGVFRTEQMYPQWARELGEVVSVRGSGAYKGELQKSLAMLSNSQSCVKALDRVLTHATMTSDAKAYLHQYEKYGLSGEEFAECLAKVEQIVADYRAI